MKFRGGVWRVAVVGVAGAVTAAALAVPVASRVESRDNAATSVADAVARWQPAQISRAGLQLAADVWLWPLTYVGFVAARAGGVEPVLDPQAGVWFATGISGLPLRIMQIVNADAITVGQVVLVRSPEMSDRLKRHEIVHVRQQERLGALFLAPYYYFTARYGYRDNPFEVAARAAE